MKNFQTRADRIIELQRRGYDQDFIIQNEGILCIQQNDLIAPDEFEIVETYHFECQANFGDNLIIFAVRLVHSDMKGILMTSFSSYNRGASIHLWSKLSHNILKTLNEVDNDQIAERVLN